MSLPLLQTSPSVELEVGTDRQLRASVVRSPLATNALRSSGDGLYAKKAERANQFLITQTTSTPLTVVTQTNQALLWSGETFDPDGLADLVAQPTRITVPVSARYFIRATCGVGMLGGSAVSMVAYLYAIKNGVDTVAGSVGATQLAAGATTCYGNLSAWLDLAAGDYLELFWRWGAFGTLTATSCAWTGTWSGFRLSA